MSRNVKVEKNGTHIPEITPFKIVICGILAPCSVILINKYIFFLILKNFLNENLEKKILTLQYYFYLYRERKGKNYNPPIQKKIYFFYTSVSVYLQNYISINLMTQIYYI